ncbi:MAG: 2-oxo acid dehydrogenase subunit E2 [Bacteroidetes bacterium]|nr:2-oxo acid dehydrogenase subunit E2 [Bacteroidota bacterium]MCW5895602.1 2-oxo acid dehydrogenase subunit E2 [Bacteroidota bacterium]
MDVRLPRLGEGADSGTVSTIFVKEGDTVKKDQSILELESEKAVASIPTPVAGTITKIHVKDGDEIKVGTLIFSVAEGDAGAVSQVSTSTEPSTELEEDEPVAVAEESVPAMMPQIMDEPVKSPGGFPPPASPSLRKMARDIGLDLSRIRGSGNGGRILLSDVKAYIQRLQSLGAQPKATAVAAAAVSKPAAVSVDFSKWGSVEKKKMSQLRKAISNKMTESWTTIPHITQFDNVDITDVLALRKKYQKAYEKKKANLTLTPFIMKAVVETLKKHPIFNASMDEAAEEIVYKNYYHLGIAVDTEQGLIVPVIRDVDKKSMLELSIELQDIAERTRQRKVSLEEMQGGSFTISNQGGIGGSHFTPIINKPEVAILGVGRGSLQAVVKNKKIVQRVIVPLGLSYDHRVIDGANAARFITDFVQALQGFKEEDVKS